MPLGNLQVDQEDALSNIFSLSWWLSNFVRKMKKVFFIYFNLFSWKWYNYGIISYDMTMRSLLYSIKATPLKSLKVLLAIDDTPPWARSWREAHPRQPHHGKMRLGDQVSTARSAIVTYFEVLKTKAFFFFGFSTSKNI
jgi:hypothetical protein